MPLIAPDPIFKGITSSGARKSVKRILDERGDTIDRYVVPCVGQFTIPEALVNGGVDPSRIQASDITLFSSTLGYLADPTRKIRDYLRDDGHLLFMQHICEHRSLRLAETYGRG